MWGAEYCQEKLSENIFSDFTSSAANFILPIKRTRQVYYELKPKTVFTSFEKVKQNIIEENKRMLYNTLSNTKNQQVFTHINYEDNVYYVTTYLKADVVF